MSTHAGHLALSAVAGVTHGAVKRDGTPPLAAALAFDLGFHALACEPVGRALGAASKPWRDGAAHFVPQGLVHTLFGALTGIAAARLARRPWSEARGAPGHGRAAAPPGRLRC